MTHKTSSTRKLLLAGVAAVFALGAPALGTAVFDTVVPVGVAKAADDGHTHDDSTHGEGSAGGKHGSGGKGYQKGKDGEARGGHAGHGLEDNVLRVKGGQGFRGGRVTAEDDDGDGPPEGAGNRPEGKGKGDVYGDLYVILRDDNGVPILADGEVQPCIDPNCVASDPSTYIQLVGGEVPTEYADQVMEVEFGRMNVGRSPQSVMDHSLAELLSKFDGITLDGTNLADYTDESGRLMIDGTTIDSPLENLALFEALLEAYEPGQDLTLTITTEPHGDETPETFTMTVDSAVVDELVTSALAAASDKTDMMSIDEVAYLSGFLGIEEQLNTFVSSQSLTDISYSDQVWILVNVGDNDGDGLDEYEPQQVTLSDAVLFNDIRVIDDDDDGIDAFTQNVDDALQVIEFIHDYAIDAPTTATN